jgi:hypothetical protein
MVESSGSVPASLIPDNPDNMPSDDDSESFAGEERRVTTSTGIRGGMVDGGKADYHRNDILLGRGKFCQHHPGNGKLEAAV